jgi:hypothetical protein
MKNSIVTSILLAAACIYSCEEDPQYVQMNEESMSFLYFDSPNYTYAVNNNVFDFYQGYRVDFNGDTVDYDVPVKTSFAVSNSVSDDDNNYYVVGTSTYSFLFDVENVAIISITSGVKTEPQIRIYSPGGSRRVVGSDELYFSESIPGDYTVSTIGNMTINGASFSNVYEFTLNPDVYYGLTKLYFARYTGILKTEDIYNVTIEIL